MTYDRQSQSREEIARTIASERGRAVKLNLSKNKLVLSVNNPEGGSATEEIGVEYAAAPLEIGFNARYVLDVLGSLNEDEVKLELGGQLDPGVIRPIGPTDFVGVIMPMRI